MICISWNIVAGTEDQNNKIFLKMEKFNTECASLSSWHQTSIR